MRTRKELRLTMMPGQAIDLVRTLVLGVLGPALLLGGCASFDRQPFEAAQIEAAHAPDSPKIRHWANSPDLLTQISIAPPPPGEPLRVLALSGGGDDGAYGAGFLNGWSQTGKRPEFAVVTGVSTGALIAPFALLGPDYDDELKRAYTEITPDDIYKDRFALAIPFSTSVATTGPLEALIARFATDAVIDAIGEEHRKGRRLFVGTVSHQHIYGLLFRLLWPLSAGRPLYSEAFQDPAGILRLAAQRPLVWVASPAHLKRLRDDLPWDAAKPPRAIFSSGGPLPADSASHLAAHAGVSATEVYGSSETGGIGWRS